jgi:hypothetical protein
MLSITLIFANVISLTCNLLGRLLTCHMINCIIIDAIRVILELFLDIATHARVRIWHGVKYIHTFGVKLCSGSREPRIKLWEWHQTCCKVFISKGTTSWMRHHTLCEVSRRTLWDLMALEEHCSQHSSNGDKLPFGSKLSDTSLSLRGSVISIYKLFYFCICLWQHSSVKLSI